MAFDVFISYSRKDLREAVELSERLQSEGITVWIDRNGIGGAKQWASEIAEAVRECDSLLLLISENIVTSSNVLKEVALASERNKPVLPVVLRRTTLSASLEYHLAGVHYLHYADYSSIVLALKGELPKTFPTRPIDMRKSLLVLPFEDLSPDQDNSWFADGLTSELITSLSKIKSLRVIDRNTSMEFKRARGRTRDIARELNVRYFLEGIVRKFRDQIKITVELLDIDTGDYLWHDSHDGVFADIFEVQERVAKKVVDGLKLSLTLEEVRSITEQGTESAEAYEAYLKAGDQFDLWTRQSMKNAISLASLAIELDTRFAAAMRTKAIALVNLYRLWERKPEHLKVAEELFARINEIRSDLILSSDRIILYILQKRFTEAGQLALRLADTSPDDFLTRFYLGYFYNNTGKFDLAIPAYEAALRIRPDHRITYWNLVEIFDRIHKMDDRRRWSEKGLHHFLKWTELHPEDQFARAQLATFQLYAGEKEKALNTVAPLVTSTDADGLALYTVAVMYMHLNDTTTAMQTLDRAVAAGFSHIELLKSDPNFNSVAAEPEFVRLLERMADVRP